MFEESHDRIDMHGVYILASYLLMALLLPVLFLHRKTRAGFLERFGFYRFQLPKGQGPRFWLHGASAGDLLSLSPMIRALRERFPGAQIVLSTITNTGRLMAQERLSGLVDAVIYAPWDLWGATRRAVAAIQPTMLVLEYTEIWPNLIHAAHRHGARIAMTNGRFAATRLGRYQFLFRCIGNPLHEIDLFLMREDDEAVRVTTLGAAADRVKVTGNTKFDVLVSSVAPSDNSALKRAFAISDEQRVWMAGSTHEGEEKILLEVYLRLAKSFPKLRLVIAPRYLERVSKIVDLVTSMGLRCALRSENDAAGAPVVILNTIGELSTAYGLADIVFVGGSFTRRGGQNILEPAAQGRPVLFGPHMENFSDSVHVLVGRGGIQVKNADHLYRVMAELLASPENMIALGHKANAAVRSVHGASERNVELMSKLVSNQT